MKEEKFEIDRDQVKSPQITITPLAKAQLELIFENDFTLTEKTLRIVISGKGCTGFDYDIGPHQKKSDDLIAYADKSFQVVMDLFTAYYCQKITLDFLDDYENDQEGFRVVNHDQKEHHGKFWKDDLEKAPPLKKIT